MVGLLATAEAVLAARGGQAIFLGRFVGLLRALIPAAAGMARMPDRTFLVWTVAGGLIWAPRFVLLGYLAGGSYQRVADLAGLILLACWCWWAGCWPLPAGSPATPTRSAPSSPASWNDPPWRALRRRYGTLLGFLARRFSPRGHWGCR
jgi:SNARE associated Golgi protein